MSDHIDAIDEFVSFIYKETIVNSSKSRVVTNVIDSLWNKVLNISKIDE